MLRQEMYVGVPYIPCFVEASRKRADELHGLQTH